MYFKMILKHKKMLKELELEGCQLCESTLGLF